MGFGGKVTLIGCKIGALNRLPASFFVSVAYDCWAFRRLGVVLDALDRRDQALALSRSRRIRSSRCSIRPASCGPAARSSLQAPLTERRVRSLKVGDVVLVSRPDVHRPRRRARAPDEARSAGRSARVGALSLRSGGGEGRRRLARHGGRTDDEHSRGAVSGRDHQAVRRARGDRQGRHGREDARGAEGARRGVPERDRRRRAVLRPLDHAASTACR